LEDAHKEEVVSLCHRHVAELKALYGFYPDNFFDPYQLGSGTYFGIRKGGELVAAAGTHVVSPTYQVAAIGNVVTHPKHRGKGYGKAVTTAVLNKIFQDVTTATLDVRAFHTTTIELFQSLGFRSYRHHLEGVLRSPSRRLIGS